MTTIPNLSAWNRLNGTKSPMLDERKFCHVCKRPFRCPTAQADRFICGCCTARGGGKGAQLKQLEPPV